MPVTRVLCALPYDAELCIIHLRRHCILCSRTLYDDMNSRGGRAAGSPAATSTRIFAPGAKCWRARERASSFANIQGGGVFWRKRIRSQLCARQRGERTQHPAGNDTRHAKARGARVQQLVVSRASERAMRAVRACYVIMRTCTHSTFPCCCCYTTSCC